MSLRCWRPLGRRCRCAPLPSNAPSPCPALFPCPQKPDTRPQVTPLSLLKKVHANNVWAQGPSLVGGPVEQLSSAAATSASPPTHPPLSVLAILVVSRAAPPSLGCLLTSALYTLQQYPASTRYCWRTMLSHPLQPLIPAFRSLLPCLLLPLEGLNSRLLGLRWVLLPNAPCGSSAAPFTSRLYLLAQRLLGCDNLPTSRACKLQFNGCSLAGPPCVASSSQCSRPGRQPAICIATGFHFDLPP